ncbi:MAG: hypothetical protein HYW65_04640 [Candidatus Liptonbacteria bacterium]|nr:hypothetical protein [Candidatus Liptonbacteria bacterium]
MDDRIQNLENEIRAIKERNLRVEADKAWETSSFRVFTLCATTYVVAAYALYVIGVGNFFLSALVPTAGFFLSVQTLPAIKRWWIRRYHEKSF